jgi:DNA-binding transcriptional ArsR family regulator
MAENVLVLEPGDERAQKIAKAMASRTAGDILTLLGEGEKSLTDIAEKLALPITTAQYHVGNLLDAGLISVASTRYSVKGREVKCYMLTNQLLIVAPRQADLRSLILRYASLFAIVVAGTLALALFSPFLSAPAALNAPAPMAVERGAGVMATNAIPEAIGGAAPSPDLAIAFFCGGVLVIAALLCYEAYLRKRGQAR